MIELMRDLDECGEAFLLPKDCVEKASGPLLVGVFTSEKEPFEKMVRFITPFTFTRTSYDFIDRVNKEYSYKLQVVAECSLKAFKSLARSIGMVEEE